MTPDFLRTIPTDRLVILDVRPLLEKGEEPFGAIMETVERLTPGDVLKLIAPFEPVPLFGILGRKGFSHWSQPPEGAAEQWQIFFYQEVVAMPAQDKDRTAEGTGDDDFVGSDEDSGIEGGDDLFDLDVRGLEAPEPLEKVLEAAERMVYGSVLRVRHHREPLILFDVLSERGFACRSHQSAPDNWEIRIWRKN